MGKQAFSRSPRPKPMLDVSYGVKEHQFRYPEMQQCGDPSLGRRGSGGDNQWGKVISVQGLRNDSGKLAACKGIHAGKRHMFWLHRHVRSIIFTFLLMSFVFLLDSILFPIVKTTILQNSSTPRRTTETEVRSSIHRVEGKRGIKMYDRLHNLAAGSLAETESKEGASKFWEESDPQASKWKPCAKRKSQKGKSRNVSGFIVISANGGLNQQRVAVCNAVAVASLLNATLVIPKFLYSNVWNDPSPYREDHANMGTFKSYWTQLH